MSDFEKLTVPKLKKLLDKEEIKYDSKAVKGDLVALAEEKVSKKVEDQAPAPTPPADNRPAGEPAPVPEPEIVQPEATKASAEKATMKTLGYVPTGKFEVLAVAKGKYRVFGAENGDPISPIFDKEVKDKLGQIMSAEGQASSLCADLNMHVRRNHGNKAYEKYQERAEKQGLPK